MPQESRRLATGIAVGTPTIGHWAQWNLRDRPDWLKPVLAFPICGLLGNLVTLPPRGLVRGELESGPYGKDRTMKWKRFTEEQIIGVLIEPNVNRWRSQYELFESARLFISPC
jgi:hypothetical protein